jgi:hypothetical protein
MIRGNTGTISGPNQVNGIAGTGYDFESSDTTDKIEYLDYGWNNPQSSYLSAFAWVQSESNIVGDDVTRYVLTTGYSGLFSDTFFLAQYRPDGAAEVWRAHVNTVAGQLSINGTSVPVINKPQHIGFTYDGTLRLYVNGVQESSTSDSSTMEYYTDNPDIVEGDSYTGGSCFDGIINEWRVYNRALSPSEVWRLYDQLTRWEIYTPSMPRMTKGLMGAAARIHDFMPFFMNVLPGAN